jgi:hypothetical protein
VQQGLKPNIDTIGFIGTTEVVPLLQSLPRSRSKRVFPQPVKPSLFCAVCGPTEVVPLLQSLPRSRSKRVFPEPVKPSLFCAVCGTTEVVPFYKTFSEQPVSAAFEAHR